MWGMLALSVVVGALFLYIPGALLLRAARISRIASIVCAPIVSIPFYMVMCILYAKMGVYASWISLFAPLALLSVLALLVGSIARRAEIVRIGPRFGDGGAPSSWGRLRSSEWSFAALYFGVGLVLSCIFFAVFLSSPDSFMQEYDNVHHLDITRAFVDSGNWSPFSVDPYRTAADMLINPLRDSGYYPTAWSCMTALVVSALGVAVPIAANAVNFIFIAMVFPLSMFLLMSNAFPEKPGVIAAGSLCVLPFSAFPWMFLLFGPLYPNAAAFSFLPLLIGCFLGVFAAGISKKSRIAAGVLFCVGVACCAFTQPNAVFTAGVFLAPFCVFQATRVPDAIRVRPENRRFARIGFAFLACLLIGALWVMLNKAPFVQSAVSHSWPAVASKPEALFDAVSLGFRAFGTQIVLAVLVVAGAAQSLVERKYLWMTCSYAISILMYVVAASSDGPLQHLVAGFWYTDSYRMAAMASIFAIPLASLGLWVVVGGFLGFAKRIFHHQGNRAFTIAGSGIILSLFVLTVYCPGLIAPFRELGISALGSTVTGLRTASDEALPTVYSAEERAFVQEVKRAVPSDALVLNVPDDGSAFAYGVDELRVYYRYLRTYGEASETSESVLIRNGLDRIATDANVRDAVRSIGATYLLELDKKDVIVDRRYLFTYEDGKNWRGVESVQDDTPGFEIVLSKDDMRLYRIVEE